MKTTSERSCRAASLLAVLVAGLVAVRAEAGSTAAQVAFTHGVLAFEKGETEEAARLFAVAVENDPEDGTFLHWSGLAELRRGRAAEAVARFAACLEARHPPAAGRPRVREDLRRARAELAAGTGAPVAVAAPPYRPEAFRIGKIPRWEGSIGAAAGWDSNPELVADDRPFLLPGERVPGGVPSDSHMSLDAETRVHPFTRPGAWNLGLAVAGHRSAYQELDGLDLTLMSGVASLSRGGASGGFLEGPLGVQRVAPAPGRLAVLLQAGGSRARLGGDLYRDAVDASASLFVRESPGATARLAVTWSDRDFPGGLVPHFRPSGRELAGRVDQWLVSAREGRPDRSLRLGVAVGRYDANRIFERTFQEVDAEAAIPLAPRWSLRLTGTLREDDFTQRASNVGVPEALPAPERRDTTWRATAAVTWQATGRLAWSLRASHARRSSNVEIPFLSTPSNLFDYERTGASLGVQWHF